MALIYKFTPEQAKEIEKAYQAAPNKWTADHLYMLLLRANGKTLENIAKEMNVDPSTISRLINKYHSLGITGLVEELANQFPRSKNIKFTAEQIFELEKAYNSVSGLRDRYRLHAVLLRAKGESNKKVAEVTGYSPTHVTYLMNKYKNNGLQGILLAKRVMHSSEKAICSFTEEQKTEIEKACLAAENLYSRFSY